MTDDEKSSAVTHGFQIIWRNIIVLLVLGGGALVAALSLLFFMHDTVIVDLGYKHFASIFGLPAAAAASLLIVLVTRAVSGPMSVEFFGLKFHGAASETIMWILCFLAIAYAVERTWPLEYAPPAAFSGTMSEPQM
jgi:hypothetical protein